MTERREPNKNLLVTTVSSYHSYNDNKWSIKIETEINTLYQQKEKVGGTRSWLGVEQEVPRGEGELEKSEKG